VCRRISILNGRDKMAIHAMYSLNAACDVLLFGLYSLREEFSPVQFISCSLKSRFLEVIVLLEEWVFRNCPLEMEGERIDDQDECCRGPVRRCREAMFGEFCRCSPHCQVATLHRPDRVVAGTETCRRYPGPVPRTQLKATGNAISSCIR